MNSRSLHKPLILLSRCPRSRFYLQTKISASQRSRNRGPITILYAQYATSETSSTRRQNSSKYPEPPPSEKPPKGRRRLLHNLDVIRKAIRANPISGGLAIFMICFAVASLVIITISQIYLTSFVKHNFPESVAAPARKALFFSTVRFDPTRAIKFYKEAIFAAQEAQLHPISDEVLGLKIHLAGFFEEKIHNPQNAAMVLEHVYKECVKWLREEGDQHFNDGHRSRVLVTAVRTAVKLGQLYGTPNLRRFDDAEEMLTVATETILKEKKRREEKGVLENEGGFLKNEEVGGSLEALADNYISRNRHELAMPLYLHALSLCPPKSCHSVVLMNNLATSIAHQKPPANPPPNFPSFEQQAALWANKAISVADTIPAGDRTDECTTGCATAKTNLAELAERAGRLPDALRLFQDALGLSRSAGFPEGVQMASSGVIRVEKALKAQG